MPTPRCRLQGSDTRPPCSRAASGGRAGSAPGSHTFPPPLPPPAPPPPPPAAEYVLSLLLWHASLVVGEQPDQEALFASLGQRLAALGSGIAGGWEGLGRGVKRWLAPK